MTSEIEMLGTVKTSGSYIGAQYIVKVFLCQPFVKEFAKKESGHHRGGRQLSVVSSLRSQQSAERQAHSVW
jgi:hypothetical protein